MRALEVLAREKISAVYVYKILTVCVLRVAEKYNRRVVKIYRKNRRRLVDASVNVVTARSRRTRQNVLVRRENFNYRVGKFERLTRVNLNIFSINRCDWIFWYEN